MLKTGTKKARICKPVNGKIQNLQNQERKDPESINNERTHSYGMLVHLVAYEMYIPYSVSMIHTYIQTFS